MVIRLCVMGGLGNQIWTYAGALSLARARGTRLAVRFEYVDAGEGTTRAYLLPQFKLDFKRVWNLPYPFSALRNRFYRWFYFPRVYEQPGNAFCWDEQFFSLPDRTSIRDSHLQNYRYFEPVVDLLAQQLELKQTPPHLIPLFAQLAGVGQAVMVHVRRGDYLRLQEKGFRVCSLAYYRRAMEELRRRLSAPHFFFFSDDPEWVQSSFAHEADCTVFSHHGQHEVHYDFVLMKRCHSFILANSSLSAAAAMLGGQEGKQVIAPDLWNYDVPAAGIFPPQWSYYPAYEDANFLS